MVITNHTKKNKFIFKKKRISKTALMKIITTITYIFACVILINTAINSVNASNVNPLNIIKVYKGNLTTGSNIQIGYIINNRFNQNILIKIKDKNIIKNSGFNVECYQLIAPANQTSIFYYNQKLLLTTPGNFTLPGAKITYSYYINDSTKPAVRKVQNENTITNEIKLRISGKKINSNQVTQIYKCNGMQRTYSSYSSSSNNMNNMNIVIRNGNMIINNRANDIDSDFGFGDIDKEIEKMHKQMNQMINQFFPQTANQPQYQQYQPNYQISQNTQSQNNSSNNLNSLNNRSNKKNYPNSIKNQHSSISSSNPTSNPNSQNMNSTKPQISTKNIAQNIRKTFFKENNKKSDITRIIKLILLLVIFGLIDLFYMFSKKNTKNLDLSEDEESQFLKYYNLIKKERKQLNKIKKDKEQYLKFKDNVAILKDNIIKELESNVIEKIIRNIDMYLYADSINHLDKALKELEKYLGNN